MARRKKKKKDDLALPEFDEVDFMKKEMRASLMMLGTVGLALLMAVVAGLLTWVLKDARIPLVIGLLGFLLLRFVFNFMKIDISDLEKTKWAGTLFTYFLTFIAIWVLLINPPLADLIPPTIGDETPDIQELGAEIAVSVTVSDNQGIDDVKVFLTAPDGDTDGPFDMEKRGRNLFWYEIKDPVLGQYNYTVEVEDKGGFFTDADHSFDVVPQEDPTIGLFGHADGDQIPKGQDITVQIKDNVGVVFAYYQVDVDVPHPLEEEKKMKMKDPRDSTITISTKSKMWEQGVHNLTICALDSVPHTKVFRTYQFTIS